MPYQRYSSSEYISTGNAEESADGNEFPWSMFQRSVMLGTSFFTSTLMSGITLGHIAFREILMSTAPNDLCSYDYMMKRGENCYHHELRLSGVFFLSTIVGKLSTFPIGMFLDHYGPRFTSMLGCLIFLMGCLFLAFSNLHLDWQQYLGFMTLAVGGTCIFIPSLQLCRLIPTASKMMMSIMTSAYDLSAAVFYIMNWVYQRVRYRYRIGINVLLGVYSIIPLLGFLLVTTFYPDGEICKAQVRRKTLGDQKLFGSHIVDAKDFERLRKKPLKEILSSLDFWLFCLFTGCMTSRFVYFLATFHIELCVLPLNKDFKAATLEGFMTFLPLGGLIGMTAIGQLLESLPLSLNVLIVWIVVILIWGPLEIFVTKDLIGLSLVLCAAIRPYYYAVTNELGEALFGQVNYGKAYGMNMIVSGLVNLMTMPSIYGGHFSYYAASNSFWTFVRCLGGISIIFPIYLFYKGL